MSTQEASGSTGNKTRESIRTLPRIDYKQFNERGRRQVKRDSYNTIRTVNNSQEIFSSASSSPSSSPPLSPPTSSQKLSDTEEIDTLLDNFCIGTNIDNHVEMTTNAVDEETNLALLQDDINDFLEENPIEHLITVNDLDAYTTRLETLRQNFRVIDRSIQKNISAEVYSTTHEQTSKKVLNDLKEHAPFAKEKRNTIRQQQMKADESEKFFIMQVKEETLNQKTKATNFLVEEVFRLITDLNKEFCQSIDDVSDEELLRRKEDYSENSLQLERLSNKFEHAFQTMPHGYAMQVVKGMKDAYAKLKEEKERYDDHLNSEIMERELLKENSFQTSSLNIKLPKF